MIAVKKVDPSASREWDQLISQTDSQVFHSPSWMRVLARTYAFVPSATVVVDGSEIRGGLVYCVLDDMRGRRVVALPFSDFCDPLVSQQSEWELVVDSLSDYEAPIFLRLLDNRLPMQDRRFTVSKKSRWHGIDLRPGTDELWLRLDGSARRAIRKARSSDVMIRNASSVEELRQFFELHLKNRKLKYRMLAQPFAFFEAIWDEFVVPGHGELLVATLGERIIAGVLFLDWRGRRYYKFNASDPRYAAARPNDLILWTAIERAATRGHRLIDLGLSDWDQEGLVRYKRKYASDEKTITSVQFDARSDHAAEPDVSAQLWPVLTDLLTNPQVPDEITEQAGNALYRYFA